MQPWYVRKAKEKSGSSHRAGIRQKALGAAVARCPRTLPGTSLGCWSYRCWNYRWYLQAPSGPDSWYISGAGSTPRGRLEIPLLGLGAARSPQLPWEGSGQQHTMHLTTRCFTEHSLFVFLMVLRHFPHRTELLSKWTVWSTTAKKIAHTGKQDPGWVSWSRGPSTSIKITEHEISYWSHATGCTSKEAQEGK